MSPPRAAHAVDSHVHVFSATAAAIATARYRPGYAATLARLRTRWATLGVTHGVIVQPSFFGTDNQEMLAAVASDRDHLRGVAVVDPRWDTDALARLDAAGVVAMRWNLKGIADYGAMASPEWSALLDRAHALGWHLECHVDMGRLPEAASAIARSGIAVVFDHFGSPGTEPRIRDATFAAVRSLASSRDVGCKLSGPYRQAGGEPRDLAARWLDAVDPGNLVWGSDWPWTGFEATVDDAALFAQLATWVAPACRAAILWDNAARLYRFD